MPGTPTGYFTSPWPAEDGGPARLQTVMGHPGLGRGERGLQVAHRDVFAATMPVLRKPGEVFLLRHTIGLGGPLAPCTSWVERIDPLTLDPVDRSTDLAAGQFWPGGLSALATGDLAVVMGNHAHLLDAGLGLKASRELGEPTAYNSMVVLDSGLIATKNFSETRTARVDLLDPHTLEQVRAPIDLAEPSIARLSAVGNTLVVVGTERVHRMQIGAGGELVDHHTEHYRRPGCGFGWDAVSALGADWILDQGHHDYLTSMRGAGSDHGGVHLHCLPHSARASDQVSADDVSSWSRPVAETEVGAVTNPPLVDQARRIVVGHDAHSGILAAWRIDEQLRPERIWEVRVNAASHHLLLADTGELVVGDYRGITGGTQRALRRLGRAGVLTQKSPQVRTLLGTWCREAAVVLDIESGAELSRVSYPSPFQSVLFPAPGWHDDLYVTTFSTLARISAD